ncbi:MAG: hypothetical protein ACTSUB_08695 [Candidatus Thorarchaeota archaeon]
MSSRKHEMEKISKLYKKYLNGPLGRGVLKRLKEGESFSIHSNEQILHITKQDGTAIIDIPPSTIQLNQRRALVRRFSSSPSKIESYA